MFSLPAMREVTGNGTQVVDYEYWRAIAIVISKCGAASTCLVLLFMCLFGDLLAVMWHLIFKIILNVKIRCGDVRYTYLPLVGIQQLERVKKKTLVINLDILIYSDYIKLGAQRLKERGVSHDFIVHVPDYEGTMVIYKRPGLDFFLEKLSNWYDLVIFSVSNEDYTKGILDALDNDDDGDGERIRYKRVYGRRSRTRYGQHAILVDNIVTARCCSVVNTIFVHKYIVGNWDTALMSMLIFLDSLRYVKDTRATMLRGRLIQ